ncbi:MarR family winged helix-turn-helix transcriptional regulator [Paenibacillus ginsengarvi]|uniref:MarR family transcriptional regulator n=1 Tax=Paenibacillus ginsengarvi TaxID=400777 RepID=A0A3B0C3I3_9BACL|nr:MarR family transcriptional regulator [Paenibacillus ginsengarvi]RKN79141.1 MarR family transcriptional regulator [Paenibacillus ginsengarvi]
MDRDDMLTLDNQMCFALYACSREMTKLYRPFLDELGITYTQYVAMLALWERDDVTVKRLGERLHLDSGTLTPLLKKLEAAGFVSRARDAQDERNVRIRLTASGEQLKERACDVPAKAFCGLGISAEEAKDLRDRLRSLLGRIHQPTMEA